MQISEKIIDKDYLGGVLMVLLGLGAALQGVSYGVGTLSEMGPGFFPTAVGTLLALIGVSIVTVRIFNRRAVPKNHSEKVKAEWAAWGLILAGIAAFVVFGIYGGFLPATFAIVFISAMGDRKNTIKSAFVLALIMMIICTILFWWALKLQLPLFTWG